MDDFFSSNIFTIGLGIIIILPILVVLFNELIYKLRRNNRHLAPPVSLFRNLVLPLIALTIVFTQVIGFERATTPVKIAETIIWILIINIALALFNALFFSGSENSLIKTKIPQLFLDIFRVVMVLVGAAIVLSAVWGADLGGMVTALGLGSFVLGLALQDTLGNLFSGIALVYEKPFSEGEVIKVGDYVGEVVEMNWRAIRLLTREKEMVIIPHLVIGHETIMNYSRPSRKHILKTNIGFSYQNPPNQVKEALMKTCLATPGILHDPPPEVKTNEYADFQIIYEVEFAIDGYMTFEEITDDFMSRIWYTAQREQLTIPFPQMYIHQPPPAPTNGSQLQQYLQHLPTMLPVDQAQATNLSGGTSIQHYGKNEYIIKEGDATGILYVIMQGSAVVATTNMQGKEEPISKLLRGDFFGEITLFTNKTSTLSVKALQDIEVLAIAADEVISMVENNPKLGHHLDSMMDARRSASTTVN